MTEIKRRASFSRCGRYRYALWREWDASLPRVLFIGLNPATADAEKDDNTMKRCMHYAREWGFGSMAVANLFAWRTTWPTELKKRLTLLADTMIAGCNDCQSRQI